MLHIYDISSLRVKDLYFLHKEYHLWFDFIPLVRLRLINMGIKSSYNESVSGNQFGVKNHVFCIRVWSFPDDGDREVVRNLQLLFRVDSVCRSRIFHQFQSSLQRQF